MVASVATWVSAASVHVIDSVVDSVEAWVLTANACVIASVVDSVATTEIASAPQFHLWLQEFVPHSALGNQACAYDVAEQPAESASRFGPGMAPPLPGIRIGWS